MNGAGCLCNAGDAQFHTSQHSVRAPFKHVITNAAALESAQTGAGTSGAELHKIWPVCLPAMQRVWHAEGLGALMALGVA